MKQCASKAGSSQFATDRNDKNCMWDNLLTSNNLPEFCQIAPIKQIVLTLECKSKEICEYGLFEYGT
jgi:hypothetical protein